MIDWQSIIALCITGVCVVYAIWRVRRAMQSQQGLACTGCRGCGGDTKNPSLGKSKALVTLNVRKLDEA